MSAITSVRVRSQRSAVAAVEKARLTVVGARPSRAPRAPFAVLVFLVLGVGVVGLLMFNTHMQQASIYATELEAKVDRLEARSQALNLELERKRDPQQVAEAARRLGMVTPANPAFVNLKDGRIDGVPAPAEAGDGLRVAPLPAALPSQINPRPKYVEVVAPPVAGQTASQDGPASAENRAGAGRNGPQNKPAQEAQGAPR